MARLPADPPTAVASSAPAAQAGLPPWLRHAVRTALHLVLDATSVAVAYYLAYLARFTWPWWLERFPITGQVPPWGLYENILFAVVPLWLMIFWYSSRLYSSPWMGSADRFIQIAKGCLLAACATMVATYVYERLQYSRMMLLMAAPVAAALVATSQALVLWLDRIMSRLEAAKPVLLVGGGLIADEVKRRINARHPGAAVNQLPELPAPDALKKLLAGRGVFEVILLKSSLPHARILEAAEICDANGAAFKMIPDLLELRLGEIQLDASLGLPAYRIQHAQLTRAHFLAKRAFDVAFSLAVMAVAFIPLSVVCLLIRLDSAGPAFYKQRRYGLRGRVFEAYKFRTMVSGAEAQIDAVKAGQAGAFFKAKADPRVTRVGALLRRFSLDEFPQFFNVLRGEMSVVGPRPLAVSTGELEKLDLEFGGTARKRLNILPGITGLWQVSGRSDVSSEQRFALDLFYIEHWSLGLDLEIILKTIPAMLSGKGAY